MKNVESLAQFKGLLNAIVKEPYQTNLYMFEAEIIEHIESGMLYYDNAQEDNALFFYLDCNEYLKLYVYVVNEIHKLISFQQNKPVVADIVYVESKGEPEIAGVLHRSGFEHLVLYKQYSVKFADLNLPESDLKGYRIAYAQNEQIPDILEILNTTFQDLTNELPNKADLEKRIIKRNILCLFSPDGKVCGCSQWDRDKETCIIKHTSLIPEVRGKGLGKKFYYEVFRCANAKNYKCWVAEDNVVKKQMDASLGYKANGKNMLKLVLK